jgi:glycerol kinase
LEGGVYNAASALNWARSLGLFSDFSEIAAFAAPPAIGRGLAFVPALSGLGCPHWDRSASGLWIGLGLETSKSDMVQSLLEGVVLRAAEIIEAMGKLVDIGGRISADGGMARNEYFLQFLANILGKEIAVPSTPDLTAMGTARLAMLGAGAKPLPPLPPPQRLVIPESHPREEQRALFAEAVRRSQGWKR